MVEFELPVPNSKVSADISAKRKLETVRRMYYARRKKTCVRPGDSPSISFIGAPEASFGDNMPFDSQPLGGSCMFGERNQNHLGFVGKDNELPVDFPSFEKDNGCKSIPCNVRDGSVDFPSCERGQEMALEHPLPESIPSFHAEGLSSPLALWETMKDISPPAMPVSISIEDKDKQEAQLHRDGMELDGDKISLSGMDVVHSGAMLQDKHDVDVLNNSNAIPECDYADLSQSLLNFANEDELLLVDVNGKDTIDKFCYDGALVNFPNDIHGKALNIKESKTIVSDKNQILAKACRAELEPVVERSLSSDVEQHGFLCSEISLPSSTSAAHPCSSEQCDGEMECTLNSEDPDIPSNDDVFFPKEYASSIMRTQSKEVSYSSYSHANLKNDKQQQSLMNKEANPAQSRIAPQMTRLDILPATNPGNQLGGCGMKCESPDDVASRQAGNAEGYTNQCRTTQETLISGPVGSVKAEALHACNATCLPLYAKPCSPKRVTSVPEAKPLTLNQEESDIDDEEIPSYSDIEAMILDMDLCPDDTDSSIDRQVSSYQNEDTRRTIIRLEQCAQSSVQRVIASRGAFAVLYGRHLKHYIRETEVILGRATNDMEVDIDLGREGPANKISRRQALIKMEADGSFLLKNLGKSLVFLNGKEIAIGQSMSLRSNSLIEIGGMAFVFEFDSKCVGQHLANATKIHQQNNIKYE
ncbi:uncharacterized protein LOC110609792 isoform X3 [Manihot esculenta]|nr:uncharacterized protein LOC110609792 isoform X3 [Manihot esculenta]OAY57481.1 hypothetical protein MANES_02G100600v8 [Manihot esculenta]